MQNKGQNLVEALIILSVIVVGGIVALTLLGGNVGNMYNSSADKVVNFNPFGKQAPLATETSGGIMSGPLGGTSENPVQQCKDGQCDIDYGEFMLTGVPENFSEVIQTTGSSGGTDSLMTLIEQIANQLEQDGDIEGSKEYRKLANLGHLIAESQNKNENAVTSCAASTPTGDFGSNICYSNTLDQSNNISLSSDLTDVLPNFDPNISLMKLALSSEIGFARHSLVPGSYVSPYFVAESSPAIAFINMYDQIMANPKYSDQLKGVTQELYLNIADISYEHLGNVNVQYGFGPYIKQILDSTGGTYNGDVSISGALPKYDPLTGETAVTNGANSTFWSTEAMTQITNPQTSVGSNLNSALICVAGWNKDTGTQCHKK